MRVLGKLFRRLFLTKLTALHDAGRLAFFGSLAPLADRRVFLRHLSPARHQRWVVYAKPPFAGPEAVLAYLSRYTHRVAISNSRLLSFNEAGVTFRYKDYRRDGADRQRVMTLGTDEFIRRFLLHLLPRGFHRIRHYGLLSASARKANLARARELLAVAPPPDDDLTEEPTRCPYAVSMLRWTHDHHRDLRPLESAQGAAASAKPNREDCFVTRHGLHHTRAAATALRPMAQLVPDVAQLRSDGLLRPPFQREQPARRASMPHQRCPPDTPQRRTNQSRISQEANSP